MTNTTTLNHGLDQLINEGWNAGDGKDREERDCWKSPK